MKNNKILIINTLFFPYKVGGAENSVRILCSDLKKEGYIPVVLTLTDKPDAVEVVDGVKVHRHKIRNVYWPFPLKKRKYHLGLLWHLIDVINLLYFYRVWKVINKEKPGIVHTNNLLGFSVVAWVAAKLNGVRIVHTMRDYYLMCPRSSLYKKDSRCKQQCLDCLCMSYVKKKLSFLVDIPVGISEFILNKHLENGYFSGKNGCVVYNKVESPIVQKEMHVSECKRIGYIGRISPSKGCLHFAKLAKELNEKFNFLMAGDGDEGYIEELKLVCNEIDFLGQVDASTFYSDIDLLFVCSDWDEPFGRVVIEALSLNVPVVVSNRGGLVELVHKDYVIDLDGDLVMQFERCVKKILNNDYKIKNIENTKNYPEIYSLLK